ncbi:MAG TPA: hypothetical protein VMU93_12210 [Caulobacteraceae bacterium]|nr:hypothetical protein [Caulobacteraceae bacterium]
MIRIVLAAALLAVLTGCADTGAGGAWYQQGDASYDALRRATDACQETGGRYRLKQRGDPAYLGDYACVKDKGR